MPMTLSEDEIDDLLYFARTGDAEEFHKLKEELFARQSLKEEGPLAGLLMAARDEQSGNGVLHMAAANGYEGQYIFPWNSSHEASSREGKQCLFAAGIAGRIAWLIYKSPRSVKRTVQRT